MPGGRAEFSKDSAAGRHLFLLAGHLSLAIGVVGLLVPIMPTSPFVVIAAACYARSSERFYRMLLENRYFGADVRRWRERRCVQRRLKWLSAGVLAAAFSCTTLLFITSAWAQTVVAALGVLAVVSVLCLPACDE